MPGHGAKRTETKATSQQDRSKDADEEQGLLFVLRQLQCDSGEEQLEKAFRDTTFDCIHGLAAIRFGTYRLCRIETAPPQALVPTAASEHERRHSAAAAAFFRFRFHFLMRGNCHLMMPVQKTTAITTPPTNMVTCGRSSQKLTSWFMVMGKK